MKSRLPKDGDYHRVRSIVNEKKLNTICTSGNCPNIGECWSNGTATFMILGDICTRACKFCGVKTGKPLPVDQDEAQRLSDSIKEMGIKHAVLTSVDRDDLPDKGASDWARTIALIKKDNPNLSLETLIPDFDGLQACLDLVISAGPEVISHNLETVERLTPEIRSRAKYQTSLSVLAYIAKSPLVAKSGIMLGLGETEEEVKETLHDLRKAEVDVVTIGQYLQPSKKHLGVKEFITPEQFERYEAIGKDLGFRHVESGPLVRSSYKAHKHIL